MRRGAIGFLILSLLIAGAGCGADEGCSAGICDPCSRHEDCCAGRCAPVYENDVISRETYLGDFCVGYDPATLCQKVGQTTGPTVRLAWDANTELDLAGYWLYQNEMSGQYTESKRVLEIPAGTETCTVGPLRPGTYFWVVTAFDRALNESGYSNEVSATME